MQDPCDKIVPDRNVPPVMKPLSPWYCKRPKGHRGECCPTPYRTAPKPPLRPVALDFSYKGSLIRDHGLI